MPPFYVFLGMDTTDNARFDQLLMRMYPYTCLVMIVSAYLIYMMINITGFGI